MKNLTEGKMSKGGQNPPLEPGTPRPPAPGGSGGLVTAIGDPITAIEEWGRKGWLISCVFGQCGDRGNMWSVDVMDPVSGKSFEKPFAVECFGDIPMVLDNEIPKLEKRMNQADA